MGQPDTLAQRAFVPVWNRPALLTPLIDTEQNGWPLLSRFVCDEFNNGTSAAVGGRFSSNPRRTGCARCGATAHAVTQPDTHRRHTANGRHSVCSAPARVSGKVRVVVAVFI